ncbi:MAG: hypothetical protein JO112_20235 [Planctomycetes bacterium]|nr:hypothetical protein [Planctomycetota bacterium]
MIDWRPHFPFPGVREEQSRALDWICEQFLRGERVVIAELGTGIGKSAIAVALAGWIDQTGIGIELNPGGTVLTSQKVLQDQYIRDFSHARDLRSAANFTCHGPVNGSCGETSRVRKAVGKELAKGLSCAACPYRTAKDDFVSSRLGITNYSYFLSESTYAGEIPPRRLLICDEAHNVEDEVRRWATVEVSEGDAKELKLALPPTKAAQDWLADAYRAAIQLKLGNVGNKLRRIVKKGELGALPVKDLANTNDRLDKRLCQINRILDKGGELLVSESFDRKNRRSLRFQPVDVTAMVQDALYSRAGRVLMTSATLLDKNVYRKSVGAGEAPYLSIPSPFPRDAFGVRFRPVGKMTYKELDRSLKTLPGAIRKILAENPKSKGIIHTVNYRIATAIGTAVKDPRLLVQGMSADREPMLKRHLESGEPTVLVSPSMMEGLDLRDDLGRFQVICKVPYPDFSDPLVERKDRSWYDWRTVRSLVQAVGRGVRSKDDWTKTYVLDLSFYDLLERCVDMFPVHLREGIEVEEP